MCAVDVGRAVKVAICRAPVERVDIGPQSRVNGKVRRIIWADAVGVGRNVRVERLDGELGEGTLVACQTSFSVLSSFATCCRLVMFQRGSAAGSGKN